MHVIAIKHRKPDVAPPLGNRSWVGESARNVEEMAGRGNWRRRMPPCNRADRSWDSTPPRKRVDFRLVVPDERADRTRAGGNRR